MGVPAEQLDGSVPEAEDEVGIQISEQEDVEVEAGEVETDAGEEVADTSDEAEEHEVVLEAGEDAPQFTQSQVNDIVARRVARLNGKKGEANEGDAAKLAEENRLLRLALEQKREAREAGPPKPDDFDEGEFDPAYIKAREEHDEAKRREDVDRQVAERLAAAEAERQAARQAAMLETKQREHYERAASLKVKDYEATEDVAIDTLGQNVANEIIKRWPDSHALLYYLGKNPGEAARLASLMKTDLVDGVAELGRLRGQIRVKPKTSKAPEPEPGIEGAISRRGEDPVLKGVRFE